MLVLHQASVAQLRKWIQSNIQNDLQWGQSVKGLGGRKALGSPTSTVASSGSMSRFNQETRRNDCTYFQEVEISTLACMKIIRHAMDGGDIEVLGMLLGRVQEETITVLDSYGLPVEGTETRVNAHMESYEYIVQYLDSVVDDRLRIVGWYHSHPGYGCWLSGIDIETQKLNQNFQDPYLAIVVDPKRTVLTGKLDIGAFRTLPEHSQDKCASVGGEVRYGYHSSKYYELPIHIVQGENNSDLQLLSLSTKLKRTPSFQEGTLISHLLESATAFRNAMHVHDANYNLLAKQDQSLRFDDSGEYLCSEQQSQSKLSCVELRSNNDSTEDELAGRNYGESNSNNVNTDSNSGDIMMDSTSVSSNEDQSQLPPAGMTDSQLETVKREYHAVKKKLQLLKVQEYESLRFYRDAFTL